MEVVSNVVTTGNIYMSRNLFYIPPKTILWFQSCAVRYWAKQKMYYFAYLSEGYWLDIGTFKSISTSTIWFVNRKSYKYLFLHNGRLRWYDGRKGWTMVKGRNEIHGPLFYWRRSKNWTGAYIEAILFMENSIVSSYFISKKLFLRMPTLGSIVNY